MPQARILTLSKNHLYVSTPKKKCKRRFPLQVIQSVSLTAHWDGVVCVSISDAVDLLLIFPEKFDFLKALKEAFLALTTKELVVSEGNL